MKRIFAILASVACGMAPMPSFAQTVTAWPADAAHSLSSQYQANGDGSYSQVVAVKSTATPPATLTSGTAVNLTGYGTFRVQVDSCSSCTVAFAGSVAQSGTTYPLATIINTQTGASVTSITANGVYQVLFAGGLWVTPTVSGTAILTMSAGQ